MFNKPEYMKRCIFCLIGLLGWWAGQGAMAQTFVVPSQMKFADIDLTIDDRAKEQIQMRVNMLAQSPDAYRLYAERAQLYFPVIEQVLAEEQLPTDFKFVPLAESGLNADMTGRGNGVGFWLMTDTLARENGLVVSPELDERKNLVTSTRAYSRYLQKCNYLMRNWLFSALAYPLGLNNSYALIDPNLRGSTKLRIDDRYHPYIFNLLAHVVVFRDKLNLAGAAPTAKLLVYNDTKGKTLDAIAQMTKVPVAELKQYNSWLNAAAVPASNSYPVLVPAPLGRATEVAALLNGAPTSEPKGFASTAGSPTGSPSGSPTVAQNQPAPTTEYPVIAKKAERQANGRTYTFAKVNGLDGLIGAEGQSIDEVAAVANLKTSRFMKLNDLKTGDYIKKGQVYYTVAKNKTGPVKDHVLSPGQSFWDVSQMYGVPLDQIYSLNRLEKAEAPQEGRVLRLQTKRGRKEPIEFRKVEPKLTPEQQMVNRMTEDNTMPSPLDTTQKAVTNPVNNESQFYAVQTGENIYSIAKKFEVQPSDIVRWNNLVGFNVEPGDLIRVKGEPATNPTPDPNANPMVGTNPQGQNLPNNDLPPLNEGLDVQANNLGTATLAGAKHVVQPGENLSRIAQKYGLKTKDLMDWNGLTPASPLRVNQELALSAPQQALNAAGSQPAQVRTHVVKKGETLSKIARQYGVTVNDLKEVNKLNSDALRLNQTLQVGTAAQLNPLTNGMNPNMANNVANPVRGNDQSGQLGMVNANPLGGNPVANPAPAAGTTGTHVLAFGDSPYMVAGKYGVTPEQVLQWNNLPADATAFPADMKVVYVADPTKAPAGDPNGGLVNNPNPVTGGGVFPANNTLGTNINNTVSGTNVTNLPAEHTVQFGDSPYSVAQKYGLKPDELLKLNNLGYDAKLVPGSKLQLPRQGAPANNVVGTQPGVMAASGNPTTGLTDPTVQGLPVGNLPAAGTIQGTPVDASAVTHRVQPGETLFGLARTYDVHVRDLYAWNGFNPETKLAAGQTVFVKEPPKDAVLTQPAAAGPDGFYMAKEGDNVYSVAKQHNIPVTDLKKWNNIDYGVIDLQPGTPLIISNKAAPVEPVAEAVYVSKPGDNIYKVASGFKIKVTDLKKWNNLAPGVIDLQPGTRLKVSDGAALPVSADPLPESGGLEMPAGDNNPAPLAETASPTAEEPGYYTAKAGDNIYSVSNDHKITVLDLKKWNNIPTGKIDVAPGTKLIVSEQAAKAANRATPAKGVLAEAANPNAKPAVTEKKPEPKTMPAAAKKAPKTHTVGRGETLSKIARDYKVTIKDLREWNKLKDDGIQAGATLKVSKD
jgi:membrane-bound lytic murein transglycosylase D